MQVAASSMFIRFVNGPVDIFTDGTEFVVVLVDNMSFTGGTEFGVVLVDSLSFTGESVTAVTVQFSTSKLALEPSG